MSTSKKQFLADLKTYRPCAEAWEWAQGFETWQELWNVCECGDWMLWIIGRTAKEEDRKRIVSIACECARQALVYTKDPRVLKCIETVEAWVRSEATMNEVRKARAAAAAAVDAAYADADAAAVDAAYAAYAAAYAAAHAAYAAYSSAYAAYAAYADADAAAAAAYAAYAASAYARKKSQKQSADIVRRHYPIAPELRKEVSNAAR